MRLDVADRLGVHPGHRLGQRDDLGLALHAGRGVADLSEPSLLMAEPRITAWMVSPSASASASRLSTTTPAPLPPTVPWACGVEGAAVAVRGDWMPPSWYR